MRRHLNQLMRIALFLIAMPAASVLFLATAHAAPGSGRAIDASVAEGDNVAVLVNIDKTSQTMTVFLNGTQAYEWPVSTGRPGFSTPSGTFTATSMNEIWYSKQWDNSPMPHAVFFMKDGHAIHGTLEGRSLGKPVSHGCVRISPANAATLFALVKDNGLEHTQVVISGETPGGDYIAGRSPGDEYVAKSSDQRRLWSRPESDKPWSRQEPAKAAPGLFRGVIRRIPG